MVNALHTTVHTTIYVHNIRPKGGLISEGILALVPLPKDTIYTKLALMPWIDDNLGHTLSGLTKIGNIIAKIF